MAESHLFTVASGLFSLEHRISKDFGHGIFLAASIRGLVFPRILARSYRLMDENRRSVNSRSPQP